MARKSSSSTDSGSGWASLNGWISAYLGDKTTGPKIHEWCQWAAAKMVSGWSADQIRDHIREAWRVHALNHGEWV